MTPAATLAKAACVTSASCEKPQTNGVVARPLKVLLAGKLSALAAPGGGETQMLALVSELRALGVDAALWRPWEHRLAEADCLHLFGSEPEHLPTVEMARRLGVPTLLSTIAWFDVRDCFREPWPWPRRLAAAARFAARAVAPRLPSWRRRLYRSVDRLLPNSNAEARQLVRHFSLPPCQAVVVPNGADLRFANADSTSFVRLAGVRDFVLYAGRIEPRKNQLGFLRATHDLNLPTVVLGDALPQHAGYYNACRRAAGKHVRFVPRVDYSSGLLASAYAACRMLALTSWYETPGLAALEAGLSGTPLVLPRGGCAEEYFGDFARYVCPRDMPGIREAVSSAYRQERSGRLAMHLQANFTWAAAARATRDAYLAVVKGGAAC